MKVRELTMTLDIVKKTWGNVKMICTEQLCRHMSLNRALHYTETLKDGMASHQKTQKAKSGSYGGQGRQEGTLLHPIH